MNETMAKRAEARHAVMPFLAMWIVFALGAAFGFALGSLWPLVIGIALGMFAPSVVRARQRRSPGS